MEFSPARLIRREPDPAIMRIVKGWPENFDAKRARAWMRTLGERLAEGAIFVIDYGFPRHEYYHPQRAMGTLMCHYRHQAHGDPFLHPGGQDVTAHVDFSALSDAARDAGLEVLG